MSTANRSPSPGAPMDTLDRDHAADSDDSLARKRQRFSEEAAEPVEVRIEADEPEDMGGDLHHAIMIEDEDDINGDAHADAYSDTFDVVDSRFQVFDQLKHLLHKVHGDEYLDIQIIANLSTWLDRHLAETAHDQELWQAKYTNDVAFFTELAKILLSILDCHDLIDTHTHVPTVQHATSAFYSALTRFCLRIVSFIPKFLEEPLPRRDSVQPTAAPQQVPFAAYLVLLSRVLDEGIPFSVHLQRDFHVGVDNNVERDAKAVVAHKSAIPSLNAILLSLSVSPRAFTDAWLAISAVVFILGTSFVEADGDYHAADDQTQVDLMFTTINEYVVPAICQKHPRALPPNFHNNLINVVTRVLLIAIGHRPMSSILCLHNAITRFDNALPCGLVDEPATELKLNEACRNDRGILGELIKNLWLLQVLKGYVSTDILDIKSKGILYLRTMLRDSHAVYNDSRANELHLVLQYLARFLRVGNFTEYIFSADSHASLVKECSDVVGFLAATGTYTDHETDIIWQACTTSVEAEFVRASFEALKSMLKYVQPPQVLHMARKYIDTPASVLGIYAVQFLTEAFTKLHAAAGDIDLQLRLKLISFDILRSLDCEPPSQTTSLLRTAALNEIVRLSHQAYDIDQRKTLYDRCIAEIKEHTVHITTSMEVLLLFFQSPRDEEAQLILDLLPVKVAVNELEHFVRNDNKELECGAHSVLQAVTFRLQLVLQLVGLSEFAEDKVLEERLWDCTIGDAALSSRAREDALDCFIQTPQFTKYPSSVEKLFHRGVDQFLPTMSPDCATPRLVSFLHDKVQEAEKAAALTDLERILEDRSWQQLTRLATTTTSENVASAGASAITDILFPKHLPRDQPQVAALQAAFARQHINCLQSLQSEQDLSRRQISINRGITLLETIYHHSKVFKPQPTEDSQPIELAGKEQSSRIWFTVQIYRPPQSSPIARTVQALEGCHIVELDKALQSTSGVNEHDLVQNGLVTRLADIPTQTLQEAGIKPESVVAIRPRYTFESDFSKVFASTSPLEGEIRARFSHLESLLDGENDIAERVYRFISNVSPPMDTRRQILSAKVLLEEIFPRDRPWRTLYSVNVLTTHLRECNKLAVADQVFILHGAKLLSGLLLDSARPVVPRILLQLLPSLIDFLQGTHECTNTPARQRVIDQLLETPKAKPPPPYVEEPKKLGLRLFDLIEQIKDANMSAPLPSTQGHQISIQAELTRLCYSVLLQLARTDDLWTKINDADRFVSAHGLMLLSKDATMSMTMSAAMSAFLKEKPELATGSYLNTLLKLLPEALSQGCSTAGFFALFREVLMADRKTTDSDERIRSIIDRLAQYMWEYRHTESPDNSMLDPTFFELLKSLSYAIDVLKSFKQLLQLGNLAMDIWNKLLFCNIPSQLEADTLTYTAGENSTSNLALRASDKPTVSDAAATEPSFAGERSTLNDNTSPRALYHGASRAICMEIVRKLCDNADDYAWFVDKATSVITQKAQSSIGTFPTGNFIRAPEACSGLTNLGMTCYMNSLLQQIYSNIQFRQFIFDTPVANPEEPDLLCHVKRLFAEMQDSNVTYVDTTELAQFLNISVDTQEDVHGFYTIFISALEQCLTSPTATAEFNAMFTGKLATQVQGSCGHISSRTEPFSDLSITVQNKNSLADSLAEFVQGEPMQGANKYKCLSCDAESGGKLVDAMRRTCLDEVPDHLTVCLKRFTFDMMGQESKNNDFFQFPEEIDLSKYERSGLESTDDLAPTDIFKLVGVIVHSGILTFGHYWSYVRLRYPDPRVSRWARLEDVLARPAKGFEEVRSECFGGNNRTHNGYVLFYQRESSFQKTSAATVTLSQGMVLRPDLPPRVKLPLELDQKIHQENIERHRVAQPFEEGFHAFVVGLIADYRLRVSIHGTDDLDRTSVTETDPMEDAQPLSSGKSQLEDSLAKLAFNYLNQVLLGEKMPDKFMQFANVFRGAATTNANVAHFFIAEVNKQPEVHLRIIDHDDSSGMRLPAREMVKECLSIIKELDNEMYSTDLVSFVKAHVSLIDHMGCRYHRWLDYFVLPFDLSHGGSAESTEILHAGYLTWILEKAMEVPFNNMAQQDQPVLWDGVRKRRVSFSPLLEFVQLSLTRLHAFNDMDDFAIDGVYGAARALFTLSGRPDHPRLNWMILACKEEVEYTSWEHSPSANMVHTMASSADPKFREILAESLCSCFSLLSTCSRPALFLMATAFISACGEHNSSGKVIGAMVDSIKRSDRQPFKLGLEVFEATLPHAYQTVLRSIPRWVPEWLSFESTVPKRTLKWATDRLFIRGSLHSLPDEPEVFGTLGNVLHSQVVRELVERCYEILSHARNAGDGAPTPQMHTLLQAADKWLKDLKGMCSSIMQNSKRVRGQSESEGPASEARAVANSESGDAENDRRDRVAELSDVMREELRGLLHAHHQVLQMRQALLDWEEDEQELVEEDCESSAYESDDDD